MPSASRVSSIAVGRLLRERREEMRLTLVEVSGRLKEQGGSIPVSTLARIEQGKHDPGVRRLHQLLRLYQIPPQLAADFVELEELATEQPLELDLEVLHREGLERWKAGDYAGGLAYLFAVRRSVPTDEDSRELRQRATLAFAIQARTLGKFRLARQIVDDLLCEPPVPSLRLNVFGLAASIWRRLGSVDMALALVRQAESWLEERGETGTQQAAWVFHQKAKALVAAGRFEDAHRALERAIERFSSLRDTLGEGRALLTRIAIREAEGDLATASSAAAEAIAFGGTHGLPQIEALGEIELGRLEIRAGRAGDGATVLERALGKALAVGDRHVEFLAHFHLSKAFTEVFDLDRARVELEAAKYFVRFTGESSPETDKVRDLLDTGGASMRSPARAGPAEAISAAAVHDHVRPETSGRDGDVEPREERVARPGPRGCGERPAQGRGAGSTTSQENAMKRQRRTASAGHSGGPGQPRGKVRAAANASEDEPWSDASNEDLVREARDLVRRLCAPRRPRPSLRADRRKKS